MPNNELYNTAAVMVIILCVSVPSLLIMIYYRLDAAVSILREMERKIGNLK